MSYTADFWQYDARLGRRWNIDPMFAAKPWMSPYHAFSNRPILNIDPNGASDDKFYDQEGNLVYDDGVGNDSYIISRCEYEEAYRITNGNKEEISNVLKQKGTRAYTSEKEAAMAWAPGGHTETRKDPNDAERAASIFNAKMKDGTNLYVLGNTVVGQKSSRPGVKAEVDPLLSQAIIGEINLLDVKKVIGFYHLNDKTSWERAVGIKGTVAYRYEEYWKMTGFVHTHPSSDNNNLMSATQNGRSMGNYIGGDIGMAIDGYNVYLVPTNTPVLRNMYFLATRKGMPKAFAKTTDAQDYYRENEVVEIKIGQ